MVKKWKTFEGELWCSEDTHKAFIKQILKEFEDELVKMKKKYGVEE